MASAAAWTAAGACGAAAVAAAVVFAGPLDPPPGPIQPTALAIAEAIPQPARVRSATVRATLAPGGSAPAVDAALLQGFAGFVVNDVESWQTANSRLELRQGGATLYVLTPSLTSTLPGAGIGLRTSLRAGIACSASAPIEVVNVGGVETTVTLTLSGHVH